MLRRIYAGKQQKLQSQASMSTSRSHGSVQGRKITLNSSETVILEKPRNGIHVEIEVIHGITRLGAHNESNKNDLTLAFASRSELCKFNYPDGLVISVEAITETSYWLKYEKPSEQYINDSIMDWILQLHIVRQETNIERRIIKLFQLLTTRLGRRTTDGYLLEHTLSHARIAEIIGSSRSTVSRGISSLRKTDKIYIDELKKQLILPAENISDHTDTFHPSI